MLQYLPSREQPLGIYLVCCIIKKSLSVVNLGHVSRKSRSCKCNAIFPLSHPDQVIHFFFLTGEGKKFFYANRHNFISLLMLHAMHLTVYYMAFATI